MAVLRALAASLLLSVMLFHFTTAQQMVNLLSHKIYIYIYIGIQILTEILVYIYVSLLYMNGICIFMLQIMNLKAPAPNPVPHTLDCGGLCGGRCKETKRPNLCKRSCGSCCVRCGCVPPGTYGNYEACPCYFHLTTRNQTRKCP
ncbi:hypothetical protein LguiA_005723 [Lonicera macranthoides]